MGRNLLSSIACLFRKRVHKAKKFVLSCKEGDFFVVECVKPGRYAVGRKMIICYGGEFYEGSDGLYWHSAKSKFMTNLYNEFRVGDFFGINTEEFIVRKPTIKEMLFLMNEVKKNGYRYNRKTKILERH